MIEEWRPVPSYPGYEASSLGRVRRVKPYRSTEVGFILKQKRMKRGHLHVRPSVNGRVTETGVHRMVCEAFNGPAPSPKHEAAHWNGVPNENFPINLRWATRQENMDDRRAHGDIAVGERNGFAKLTEEDVNLIRSHRMFGERAAVLSFLFGVSEYCIYQIINGKTWKHLEFQL